MKRTERHKLKQNEFVRVVARAQETLAARSAAIMKVLVGIVLLIVLAGVYTWWRGAREADANALLAAALATYETPVVPPQPPAPGSPPPLPQPGTFASEQERLDAALPRFLEAADAHPDSQAGITARFHAAAILASMGRHPEAEIQYRDVIDRAGTSIYGRTARMGLAESLVAQGRYDEAVQEYTTLRDADSPLPIDSVLMHLGRAYHRAGRQQEAIQSFTRIVEEFPLSPYASEARRELDDVKRSAAAAGAES
jgi:tetratricopeptide (TPR) repeat protein